MNDTSHDATNSSSRESSRMRRSDSSQSVSDALERTARGASEKVSELYSSGRENVKRMSDEVRSQPKPHHRTAPASSSRSPAASGKGAGNQSVAGSHGSTRDSTGRQIQSNRTTITQEERTATKQDASARRAEPGRKTTGGQSTSGSTHRYAHGGDATNLKNGSRLKQTDSRRGGQTPKHAAQTTRTGRSSTFAAVLERIPKPAFIAAVAVVAVLVVWGCWNLVASSGKKEDEEADYDVTAAVMFNNPVSTAETAWVQGEVPYLYQIDARWAEESYAGGTVAQYGSGPTSLAMVYICLTGNTDMGVLDMCDLSTNNGYATEGGTSWTYMVYAASYLGLTATELELTYSDVSAALEAGEPVILKMGTGTFATEEGYIVLTGIDDDGKVQVRDPASAYNTARQWSLKKLLKQADAGWAYTY